MWVAHIVRVFGTGDLKCGTVEIGQLEIGKCDGVDGTTEELP
jgi:hypothetical protein